jgi:hypothetical protein
MRSAVTSKAAPPGPPGPPGDAGAPLQTAISIPERIAAPVLPRPTFKILAAAMPAEKDEADAMPVDSFSDVMSDVQLAGAAHVGEGSGRGAGHGNGGGGGCDVGQMVQQALRRDRLVRDAVAGANRLGKSLMVWNGDWVRAGA